MEELDQLDYEEQLCWHEYFARRPYGWREDNRAAVIAMSFGGSDKLKPSDLFHSLKVIQDSNSESTGSSVSSRFYERFKRKFTEEDPFND